MREYNGYQCFYRFYLWSDDDRKLSTTGDNAFWIDRLIIVVCVVYYCHVHIYITFSYATHACHAMPTCIPEQPIRRRAAQKLVAPNIYMYLFAAQTFLIRINLSFMRFAMSLMGASQHSSQAFASWFRNRSTSNRRRPDKMHGHLMLSNLQSIPHESVSHSHHIKSTALPATCILQIFNCLQARGSIADIMFDSFVDVGCILYASCLFGKMHFGVDRFLFNDMIKFKLGIWTGFIYVALISENFIDRKMYD